MREPWRGHSGIAWLFDPDSIEINAMSRWGAASRKRGYWGGIQPKFDCFRVVPA